MAAHRNGRHAKHRNSQSDDQEYPLSFPLGLGKSDQVQDPKPTGPRLGARPPQGKIGADFGVPRYFFFSRDAWSAVIAVAALKRPQRGGTD
jgi:hypothetical protein